jgi:signal transduction histidine kinase
MAGLESATLTARHDAERRIIKQVDRITAMVNDILEFTRGNPRAIVLAPEDYGAFVTSVLEDLSLEIAHKAARIDLPGAPPAIRVALDPPRLARVFHNLVFNAVEAMPDGGVVTVRFQVTETEVITEIADSGKGIAPEIIDRLFEPFATFGKTTGTGLGLSICRRILEEHRGRIWARNEPGAGAVFTFSLPRR